MSNKQHIAKLQKLLDSEQSICEQYKAIYRDKPIALEKFNDIHLPRIEILQAAIIALQSDIVIEINKEITKEYEKLNVSDNMDNFDAGYWVGMMHVREFIVNRQERSDV